MLKIKDRLHFLLRKTALLFHPSSTHLWMRNGRAYQMKSTNLVWRPSNKHENSVCRITTPEWKVSLGKLTRLED